jgi:hypothetical protein
MIMVLRYLLLGLVLAGLATADTQPPAPPTNLDAASAAELLPLAEQGDAVAQYYLSRRYALGEGVEPNVVQAYVWALLAEDGGVSIFGTTARLRTQMTDAQIAEAQSQFKGIIAKSETAQAAPAEPNQTKTPAPASASGSASLRFRSEQEQFAVDFPSMPKRLVIQEQPQVDAVYYVSRGLDDKTQYSLSLQTFKNQQLQGEPAQTEFFNHYLNARAVMSVESKLYRKIIRFRGFGGVRFKHNTLSEQIERTHEGIVFIHGNTAVSLLCVYPAQTTPSPTFKDFTDSFELIQKDAASQ